MKRVNIFEQNVSDPKRLPKSATKYSVQSTRSAESFKPIICGRVLAFTSFRETEIYFDISHTSRS